MHSCTAWSTAITPHSTVANPGLAVARSNARTGQRQSTKAWLPPDITQAKAVAGDKYVALAGSQATQQCLRAGLLDEIQVALVPLLLGGDVRLFATSADRSAWKSSACSMLQA